MVYGLGAVGTEGQYLAFGGGEKMIQRRPEQSTEAQIEGTLADQIKKGFSRQIKRAFVQRQRNMK